MKPNLSGFLTGMKRWSRLGKEMLGLGEPFDPCHMTVAKVFELMRWILDTRSVLLLTEKHD